MYFERNGARMRYEARGAEGPALVLLHGWGGSQDSFLPVIRDFEPGRRLITLDFPGHGGSPEPPEAWSVTEYAEMTGALLDFLGVRGADVVAHSFGGRVALVLASGRPELVGKLVLTGCAGLKPKQSGKRSAKTRLYKVLRAMTSPFSGKIGARMRESLVQKFGSEDYRALSPSMRETFKRVVAQDLEDTLPMIKAPTLLYWGETDSATPLWMGEHMKDVIRDAGLIVEPGVGHFAYLDRYDRFRAILDSFLTKAGEGRT